MTKVPLLKLPGEIFVPLPCVDPSAGGVAELFDGIYGFEQEGEGLGFSHRFSRKRSSSYQIKEFGTGFVPVEAEGVTVHIFLFGRQDLHHINLIRAELVSRSLLFFPGWVTVRAGDADVPAYLLAFFLTADQHPIRSVLVNMGSGIRIQALKDVAHDVKRSERDPARTSNGLLPISRSETTFAMSCWRV